MVPPTQATAIPRTRRSQAERSATTQGRLIAATVEALSRFGYAATSTTLVADLAGVSRGAMLHQFPTKVALMAATARSTYESDIVAYRSIRNESGDFRVRMDVMIEAAWEQLRAPGGLAQTEIWMASRSDPDLAAAVMPIHREMFDTSRYGMAQFLKTGGIDDPALAAHVLQVMVAVLRGLALERILGAPRSELDGAVSLMKDGIYAVLREKLPRA